MLFMTVPEVMLVSAAENDPGYTVSLSPSAGSVETESEFTVSVLVSAETSGAEIAALQTGITFDTDRVEYVGVSVPSDSGLEAEASVSGGTVTLGVYGNSQNIPDGGSVSLAQLTFRALTAGNASFGISSAVAGMSGHSADIPAAAAEAVSVTITESSSTASGDYDLTFGMENDGLTWTVLTVDGKTVNREMRGGETLSNIIDPGETVTFSIKADPNVQYINVAGHRTGSSYSRATVTESEGIYTMTMPQNDWNNYSIDASTLTISESEYCSIEATLNKSAGTGILEDWIYANFSAEITPDPGKELVRGYLSGSSNLEFLAEGMRVQDGIYYIDPIQLTSIYESRNNYADVKNLYLTFHVDFATDAVIAISTEEQLREFAQQVNAGNTFLGETVRLESDIILTQPWTEPIGKDTAHPFRGTFDGNGHTISGLEIDYTFEVSDNVSENAKNFGLFGYLQNATMENLTVAGTIGVDDPVTDWGRYSNRGESCFGGIAAYASDSDFISCTSEVDITAHGGYIGGIAGYSDGSDNTFTDCFNYGNLEVTRRNTSVCGITSNSLYTSSLIPLLRCGNYGNITVGGEQIIVVNTGPQGSTSSTTTIEDLATGYAAGLSVMASVRECFNKGTIRGIASSAGGVLVTGSVSDSYNTGTIELTSPNDSYYSSSSAAGGLIAFSESQNFSALTLENCYNSGSVSNVSSDGVSGFLCGRESDGLTVTNCYSSETDPSVSSVTAALLNGADRTVWKDDTNSVNGNMPLLSWEDGEPSDGEYTVTFDTGELTPQITVYSDSLHTEVIEPEDDGTWLLPAGAYYYTAKADGYFDVSGSFSVIRRDITVNVLMQAVAEVTFEVTPADASFTLSSASGETVEPASASGGTYLYRLNSGATYEYTAEADGYNGTTRQFTATNGSTISVELTRSDYGGGGSGSSDQYIWGSENAGRTHTITSGGTYYIAEGATGVITVDTTAEVTLVGRGVSVNNMYEELAVDCVQPGSRLTIQDVYIYAGDTSKARNMIDFTGEGNYLYFRGTSILDTDRNAEGYAMIHVNQNTSLTIGGVSDSDSLYFYKREQGAGIGGNGGASGGEGQEPETNGKITITGGNFFMKNSKQGALIGAGANASTLEPGDIIIEGGTLHLAATSRGGAIGGSAGSGGASSGSNVYVRGGTININVDWSGSAIGGGGYDGGNDADGGTLYYTGGSIRTFIDQNATGSWNVSSPGVNGNIGITADIVDESGEDLYLLILDTDELRSSSGTYTVSDGSRTIYRGGLHEYEYVCAYDASGDAGLTYTMDNWTSLDDSNLYLYVTGEDHTLDVNGETVQAAWDSASETFTLTYSSGATTGGGGTTENPDITTVVETEVTVENGKATAEVSEETVNEAIRTAEEENAGTIRIDASAQEDVSSTEVTIPQPSVGAVSEAGTALEITTSNGSVTLPNDSLADIEEDLTVILTEQEDGSVSLEIRDGSAPADLSVPVKLTLPVSGDDTEVTGSSSDVIWLVNEDGTRQIVPYGIVQDSQAICLLDSSATVVIGNNPKTFTDVSSDAWYADSVAFASAREMFDGIGNGLFDPQGTMTRAMLVQLLMNIEDGQADPQAAAAFTDVSSDAWYADAVSWAAGLGLVNGYGNGTFGPSDSITREQLAVLLYNYVRVMNYPVSLSVSGDLTQFSDADQVSAWSSEALSWAVGAGIINGNADGTLNPKGTATRAEAATLMSNFTGILLGVSR